MADRRQDWRIGGLTVTRVLEAELPLPGELLSIGADPEALLASSQWATPGLATEDGRVYFALAATCVESEDRKIVIDPWISFDPRRAQPDAAEQAARQLEALADVGFAPEQVDLVVSTHIDGIGWSTRPDGSGTRPGAFEDWVPSFPNARYVWTSLEIDRVVAEGGGEAASLAPLLDAGCVDAVSAPHALTSEIRLEPAPGHTPGNVNVWIESGGDAAVVVGDLLVHPLQLADPDWGGLDADPEQARAARRSVLMAAEKSGALVIGPHFPTPGAFRIESAGGAWRPMDPPASPPPAARGSR